MLRSGTKIKIKSQEEIQKTLDFKRCSDGVYFNSNMSACCGKTFTIQAKSTCGTDAYELKESNYIWSLKWFDIIDEKSEYFNNGSIEERSLCLALIRQTLSGNKPDLKELLKFDSDYPNSCFGGFDYCAFNDDNWSGFIAKHIPDWQCIKLKPAILEEAIENCLSEHNLDYFKKIVDKGLDHWFTFHSTSKESVWYYISDHDSEISTEINREQPIKTQEDEIKFQRKKASILRGTVPEGNRQSSGKCKTATCSGYICYQVCTGR